MISTDIRLMFLGETPGAQCLTVQNTYDYGQSATDLASMLNEKVDLESHIGCANCVARLDRKKPPCVKAYAAGNSQVNILCTVTSDKNYYHYPKPCQSGALVGTEIEKCVKTGYPIETSQPILLINWESVDLIE